jgi:hypothetical protein
MVAESSSWFYCMVGVAASESAALFDVRSLKYLLGLCFCLFS